MGSSAGAHNRSKAFPVKALRFREVDDIKQHLQPARGLRHHLSIVVSCYIWRITSDTCLCLCDTCRYSWQPEEFQGALASRTFMRGAAHVSLECAVNQQTHTLAATQTILVQETGDMRSNLSQIIETHALIGSIVSAAPPIPSPCTMYPTLL